MVKIWLAFIACVISGVVLVGCGSESVSMAQPQTVATTTSTSNPISVQLDGHELFASKGCAACHGQDAEGTTIAPALAGHSEATVLRQVRTPRLQMPAFSESQISINELESIAHYIENLQGEGHAHHEEIALPAAVEMHHWMALEALSVDEASEAIHHVEHIIELLEPGNHHDRMVVILASLNEGESHEAEHDIEEMLAGSAAPGLTGFDLRLEQALAALAAKDEPEARHHLEHARETAEQTDVVRVEEALSLLDDAKPHDAEHEIRELLHGEAEEHQD